MLNLFAFRATKPDVLHDVPDPVGPLNDAFLRALMRRASRIVACWGNRHGVVPGRDVQVGRIIRNGVCFGLTKADAPRHPLYVRYGTRLRPF